MKHIKITPLALMMAGLTRVHHLEPETRKKRKKVFCENEPVRFIKPDENMFSAMKSTESSLMVVFLEESDNIFGE
jgi:hypothetical protein